MNTVTSLDSARRRPSMTSASRDPFDVQAQAWRLLRTIYSEGDRLRSLVDCKNHLGSTVNMTHEVMRSSLLLHVGADELALALQPLMDTPWGQDNPAPLMSMGVAVGCARKFSGRLGQAIKLLESADERADEALLALANIMRQYDHGTEVHLALTEDDEPSRPAA